MSFADFINDSIIIAGTIGFIILFLVLQYWLAVSVPAHQVINYIMAGR